MNYTYELGGFRMPLGKHLSREEEEVLFRRFKRNPLNEEVVAKIVSAHIGLVIKIAARYLKSGHPIEDLIQEGVIGLLKAMCKFDWKKGNKFATYSTFWIRALIIKYILDNKGPVKAFTARDHRKVFFGLSSARAALERRGEQPTTTALAKWMGVAEDVVGEVLPRLSGGDVSLNASLSHGGDTRQDLLASGEENVFGLLEARDEERNAKEMMSKALVKLNERELSIVKARHLRESPATLAELGKKFGLSRERVRQIEAKAMEKVKKTLIRLREEEQ